MNTYPDYIIDISLSATIRHGKWETFRSSDSGWSFRNTAFSFILHSAKIPTLL